MRYLIQVYRLICLLVLLCEIDANILRRKPDNKENDVIIITDFKGDSLSKLLNQLKANSSLRPISERIERTIKLSNLKNGQLTNSLATNQLYGNYKFGPFNSLIDRTRFGGKLSDKFNGGADKQGHKLFGDKYTADKYGGDKTPSRPYTFSYPSNILNGFSSKFNQNNPKPPEDAYSANRYVNTGYANYYASNSNSPPSHQANSPPLTYPLTYNQLNQLKDQPKYIYATPLTAYPTYPTTAYLPYTIKPTTYDPYTVKPTTYEPYTVKPANYDHQKPTTFDQNKYLPANYDQNNFASAYINSTSVQSASSSPTNLSNSPPPPNANRPPKQPMNFFESDTNSGDPFPGANLLSNRISSNTLSADSLLSQYNLSNESDADSDDYEAFPGPTSGSQDDSTKRNMFDHPQLRRQRFRNYHLNKFPPSIPFHRRYHRNRPYLGNHHHLANSINSQLGNALSASQFGNLEQQLSNLDGLNGDRPNQSTILSNEFINSLINKLSERKLLNLPATDDKTSIKNLPIFSSQLANQLVNGSLDQDDLLKNTQLLSKFEQINNKILTNLLLTTYLNNLNNKNQPKINASLNKNNYLDAFEDDSQSGKFVL